MPRRRWLIIAILLPVYMLALMTIALVLLRLIAEPGDFITDPLVVLEDLVDAWVSPEVWGYLGTGALIVTALQFVMLIPIGASRPPRSDSGRSLKLSLVLAGLAAAALTAGVLGALTELVAMVFGFDDSEAWAYPVVGLTLIGSWVIWSLLFIVFSTDLWADRRLGRIVGLLLAGTAVEVILLIPLDVIVRRRTDCYCGTGTFLGLCLSATVAFFLAGPGIVILLRRRRFRAWRLTHCGRCAHPKGPTPGDRCPECGFEWRTGNEKRAVGPASSGTDDPSKGD